VSAAPQLDSLEAQVDDGLGQLIQAARGELAALERQREDLEKEIAAQARRLRAWETARRTLGRQPAQLRAVDSEPPTKREAVLALLSQFPSDEFKLIEIRRALIERGWMTHAQAHALEVAVIEMARRGEIHRVRKGYYVFEPRKVRAGSVSVARAAAR
jgi:hypothetical protein